MGDWTAAGKWYKFVWEWALNQSEERIAEFLWLLKIWNESEHYR